MQTTDLRNPNPRQYKGQRISKDLSEFYVLKEGEVWAWTPDRGGIIVCHPERKPKFVHLDGTETELII